MIHFAISDKAVAAACGVYRSGNGAARCSPEGVRAGVDCPDCLDLLARFDAANPGFAPAPDPALAAAQAKLLAIREKAEHLTASASGRRYSGCRAGRDILAILDSDGGAAEGVAE